MKYPFIVKDKNQYFVLYAEGTKSKQFDTYKQAKQFKNICSI